MQNDDQVKNIAVAENINMNILTNEENLSSRRSEELQLGLRQKSPPASQKQTVLELDLHPKHKTKMQLKAEKNNWYRSKRPESSEKD